MCYIRIRISPTSHPSLHLPSSLLPSLVPPLLSLPPPSPHLLSLSVHPFRSLFSSVQPPVDWMLLLVIAAMVAVDIVFFVIVTSIDSSRFYATEQRTAVGPHGHTAHNTTKVTHSSPTLLLYVIVSIFHCEHLFFVHVVRAVLLHCEVTNASCSVSCSCLATWSSHARLAPTALFLLSSSSTSPSTCGQGYFSHLKYARST